MWDMDGAGLGTVGIEVSLDFFHQNDSMFLCAAALQGEKQAWNSE